MTDEAGRMQFLPSEVVSRLVALIDAFSLAKLWLTGSLRMQQCLSYGVEDFWLVTEDNASSTATYKMRAWPGNMISRFPRLKRLHIDIGRSYCLEHVVWNDVPSTIESLKIKCVNAWTILYDDHAPLLWFDAERREYPDDDTAILKIGTQFPNLQILHLHGFQRDSTNPIVNDRIVASLPRNLTEFEFPWYVSFTDSGIAALPEYLGTFTCDNSSKWVTSGGLSKLPRFITRLYLQHPQLPDKFTYTLPQRLETLLLHSNALSSRCFGILPRSLVWLSIQFNASNSSDDDLVNLPPDLLHLELHTTIGLREENVQYLPRKLENLLLHSAPALSDDGIPHLPETLKRLRINENRLLSDRCIPLLPRNLHHLELLRTNKITGDSASQLPPSLLTLILPECKYFHDDHIPSLPRSINTLSLNRAKLTIACKSSLPPNITHIYVSNPTLSKQLSNGDTSGFSKIGCCIQ